MVELVNMLLCTAKLINEKHLNQKPKIIIIFNNLCNTVIFFKFVTCTLNCTTYLLFISIKMIDDVILKTKTNSLNINFLALASTSTHFLLNYAVKISLFKNK